MISEANMTGYTGAGGQKFPGDGTRDPGYGLIGAEVMNPQGEAMGTVAHVTVGPNDTVNFLIVAPSLPQLQGQYVAIPYNSMAYRPTSGVVTVDISKDQLAHAPSFSQDQWPTGNYRANDAYRYFGQTPYFTE